MTLAMSLATWQGGGEEGGEEEERRDKLTSNLETLTWQLASGPQKTICQKHPKTSNSLGILEIQTIRFLTFRWIIRSSHQRWAVQTQQCQRAPDALQPELCPVLGIGTFLLDTCSATGAVPQSTAMVFG